MARKMRDSGVEWIGEVPEGWGITRLRFIADITTGNKDTQDANPDGAYPFYVRSPIVERSTDYTFDGLGIMMAGDGAGAGRVFIWLPVSMQSTNAYIGFQISKTLTRVSYGVI